VTRKLANFVMFQVGWFACVMGAARGETLLGCGIMLVLVATHVMMSPDRRSEGVFIAIAAVIGLMVDCVIAAAGLVTLGGQPGVHPELVLWLLALWAGFAMTFNWSMSWLRGRPLAAGVVSAVAGPLAYLGGERLGAVRLSEPAWPSLLALAVEYGVLVPLLFALTERMVRPRGAVRAVRA
jgi:hypothetical protein